jgi:alkanesulfonate monooxygenase SsuD/methylene tetrahydromethanopterin reductase-like flavin-dependent oxidoreductase (luciferase family)
MAASLDNLSGGRLILGLGIGWHEGELRAYGYDFEGPETRVRRLNEAASIIKTMWTEESPTFKGRHYTIEKAHCTPKPAQKPHPPLLIAGAGEQLTLKTVARYADISNYAAWTGSYEDFRAKSDVLNRYCDRIGRDPREILRSWAAYCLIEEEERSSDMSADQYTQKMQSRYSSSSGRRPPLCGNPEQVIGQVENYIKAGVDLFMIRFMGENFVKEASLFAREVMPHFT